MRVYRNNFRSRLGEWAHQGASAAWSLAKQASYARSLVKLELALLDKTPPRRKVEMWRRGFASNAPETYRMELVETDYLPDVPYLLRGAAINGRCALLLNDKLVFHHVLRSHADLLPRHFACLSRGNITPLAGEKASETTLSGLVRRVGPVVLKARRGSLGRGLYFAEPTEDGFTANDEPLSATQLDALALELEDYLVCERVVAHRVIREMAPRTTNCVRLLTLWDDQTNAPFLAGAALSLGTNGTYPGDVGGVSAPIDLETGTLGRARTHGDTKFIETHPDTGVRVTGAVVPHWDTIKAGVLVVCRDLFFVPHIGWDVAVTEDGFKIIEGNNHPALRRHQAHHPLLRDPRVRRFYERHGVL